MSIANLNNHPRVLLLGLALLLGGCGSPVSGDPSSVGSEADPLTIHINFPPPKTGGGGGGQSAGAIITPAEKLLFFGENCGGAVNHRTLTLRNTGTANLIIRELALSGSEFALVSKITLPATIKPGNSLDVELSFSAAGTHEQAVAVDGTLTVGSNAGNLKVLTIPLRGILAPETLSLSSRQIDFGEQLVGNATTHHLTLHNVGVCQTSISGYTASGNNSDGVAVSGLPAKPLAPGESRTVSVTVVCEADGDLNLNLSFNGSGSSLASANLIGLCFSP